MNLIAFSIRTKGVSNFRRRLWTVFTRFGFTEHRARRALDSIIQTVAKYGSQPTFFIPATVLNRHRSLISTIERRGTEIGIHGYVHNDYRHLTSTSQYEQTASAIGVFCSADVSFTGFRNPYLGWTDDSLEVFRQLGFTYDSNEAVLHDVIDRTRLTPELDDGFEKSLALFQAIPCTTYTLLPHYEQSLLRIPTSIPDDEMLFDRLRMSTDEVGSTWCSIMDRVFELGGIYVLNMHPERGVICRPALQSLIGHAHAYPQAVWLATLREVAAWWAERTATRISVSPAEAGSWRIDVSGSDRCSTVVRNARVSGVPHSELTDSSVLVKESHFTVISPCAPVVSVTADTSEDVRQFLSVYGFPWVSADASPFERTAVRLSMPSGLGETRSERIRQCSELIETLVKSRFPLLWLNPWPNGNRAALSITGDIDSVTIQDFFLRVLEVQRNG